MPGELNTLPARPLWTTATDPAGGDFAGVDLRGGNFAGVPAGEFADTNGSNAQ